MLDDAGRIDKLNLDNHIIYYKDLIHKFSFDMSRNWDYLTKH